jgi:hypothetical protein
MTPRRCETCRYFDNVNGGLCRHSPPVRDQTWPATSKDDWCGSWVNKHRRTRTRNDQNGAR